MVNELKIGAVYQHYSGKRFRVIALAHNCDNLEETVVYQALYNDPEFGSNAIWTRAKKAFMETVNVNGVETPRFKHLPTEPTIQHIQ